MARLLILRTEEDARRSAAALERLGHQAIVAPIVMDEPTGARVAPGDARGLIATSRRALTFLAPVDAAMLADLPLFAVGKATAAAARQAGFRAVTAGGGRAETLLDAIRCGIDPPGPLLYLAGEPRRPLLEIELAAAGYRLETHLLYRMRPAERLSEAARQALARGEIDAVLHYSARMAALFAALVAREPELAALAARPLHLCLSEAVAAAARQLPGIVSRVAAEPLESALFERISDLKA